MIYLASPYSSPDELIQRTRYLLALQTTATLISRGLVIFSPIVHCHEMAERHKLPGTFEFWRAYNISILRRCDQLFVLRIPGWRVSKGVQEEIRFADLAEIPISYINDLGDYTDENY